MMELLLDTNIIIRFLLKDNDKLFRKAEKIFRDAAVGKFTLILDDVILAETVWTLTSYYKLNRKEVKESILYLLESNLVYSKNEKVITVALDVFSTQNLSFIDCWLLAVSQENNIKIKSFDEGLLKAQKTK